MRFKCLHRDVLHLRLLFVLMVRLLCLLLLV